MGVTDFWSVFGGAGRPVKNIWAELKGKRVALDMNGILYKTIKALGSSTPLTNAAGVPTAGLVTLSSLLPKLKKAGVAHIIGVFDNPGANPLKAKECAKRRQLADDAGALALETDDPEEKTRLESCAWRMTEAVIIDAQRYLTLFGAEVQVAAIGREAEQHAADLAKLGLVDVVFSDDSDAVMFGAPVVVMAKKIQVAGQTYKHVVFELKLLLERFGLTLAEFLRVCLALGTDFALKTRGVGPKTALTSGKNKALSDEQVVALAYIVSDPVPAELTVAAVPANVQGLIDWLVESHSFSRERTQRMLTGSGKK